MLVLNSFEELIENLISKKSNTNSLIGIDGFDGVGKTTLAYKLAQELSGSRIELDCYLDRSKNASRYSEMLRLENLAKDINENLQIFPYVFVDGVCLLESLDLIRLKPTQTIYVKKISPMGIWNDGLFLETHESGSKANNWLENAINTYHINYRPHENSTICFNPKSN